ncbi:MAG TPA: hypothetical protein VFK76_04055 [Gaiellaceae bacterium]|nr:hypothetical protein [Gaiellaceae bacterium]
MHARIVRMDFTGDPHELARRAEDGLLPILRSLPGFEAYTVVQSGEEIFSFSGWDIAEQAEAAGAAALSWVGENMAGDIELKETVIGEILIPTTLGITAKAGATA